VPAIRLEKRAAVEVPEVQGEAEERAVPAGEGAEGAEAAAAAEEEEEKKKEEEESFRRRSHRCRPCSRLRRCCPRRPCCL